MNNIATSGKDSRNRKYRQLENGQVIRLTPRPWRGKSERRKVIKNRREDRMIAAARLELAMAS